MKNRYRLYRRKNRVFYSQDGVTRRQESLGTRSRSEAEAILQAKNSAGRQAALNFELAKAYLAGSDPKMIERTWADVIGEFSTHGRVSTQERSSRMARSPTLKRLINRKLLETTAEDLLDVLRGGGAATNNYLRRYHNLALKLGWLARPILHPAAWPRVTSKRRRAITRAEYEAILAAEKNRERHAYYQLLWETGAAQSDGALIRGEDIDWEKGQLFYERKKLRAESPPCALALSSVLTNLLKDLPSEGYLFPRIARESSNWRAAEFRRRCRLLEIKGISLHSFRYAWAERACQAGIPERYAQAALGHASKAVHRAYARAAVVVCPAPG